MKTLFLILLGVVSCNTDQMLVHEVEKEVEVYIEVPSECEVVEEIIVEDTAFDFSDIWIDSLKQVAALDGVDIFWIIDPSGSMNNDQENIINGIHHMMMNLPEVGWRLMILPSDYRQVGDLTTFPIVPGDTLADVEHMYSLHMSGAFEAGFDAAFEYIIFNPYASTWLRNDASALFVFVSDEEEQSQYHFSSHYDFISWVSSFRQNVFIASIVNVDQADTVCTSGHVPQNVGHNYIDVTTYFSGNVIDICSEDWSAGVAQASTQITPYEYIDLTHVPMDPAWIYVYIDGVHNTDWYYEPAENRLYFTVIPPANSLVEVAYNY
tara:strand:- start:100 stop:1065 length:966 start_codon:yes stop_codon:yes gene_type:complete